MSKKIRLNKKSLFHKLNNRFKTISVLEKWCESNKISLSEFCLGRKLCTKSIYVSFVQKFNLKNVPRNRNLSDQLLNVVVARSAEINSLSEKTIIENTISITKRGNKSNEYNIESCNFKGFEKSGLPNFNNFYDKQIAPRKSGIFKVR